jgi:hypothetical protein
MVVAHIPARVALSIVFVVAVVFILNPMYAHTGVETTTTQATDSK